MSTAIQGSIRTAAALLVYAICFWPVWRWFASRVTDGSDEPWGLAALLAAIACSWPRDHRFRIDATDRLIAVAALLTCIYAALLFVAPPIVRAVVALAAMACVWVAAAGARNRAAVVIALFVLSLPLIASLQFYAGYPLRAATAAAATHLLNLFGFDIARSGVAMSWNDRTILVDAPCSGVRMLWTASCLACVLVAARSRVSLRDLAVVLLPVLPVVVLANALRAAALFVVETRFTPLPGVVHTGIGVLTFLFLALTLIGVESLVRRRSAGHRFTPAASVAS